MSLQTGNVARLSELNDGEEADFFALLVSKEELTTRDKKPYCRVTFRDSGREVGFPIWSDSVWAAACREDPAVFETRVGHHHHPFGT